MGGVEQELNTQSIGAEETGEGWVRLWLSSQVVTPLYYLLYRYFGTFLFLILIRNHNRFCVIICILYSENWRHLTSASSSGGTEEEEVEPATKPVVEESTSKPVAEEPTRRFIKYLDTLYEKEEFSDLYVILKKYVKL